MKPSKPRAIPLSAIPNLGARSIEVARIWITDRSGSTVVIDAGVKIPNSLVVGDDPVLDAQRFRRTDRGVCLITQPMIDRLGL